MVFENDLFRKMQRNVIRYYYLDIKLMYSKMLRPIKSYKLNFLSKVD